MELLEIRVDFSNGIWRLVCRDVFWVVKCFSRVVCSPERKLARCSIPPRPAAPMLANPSGIPPLPSRRNSTGVSRHISPLNLARVYEHPPLFQLNFYITRDSDRHLLELLLNFRYHFFLEFLHNVLLHIVPGLKGLEQLVLKVGERL